MNDQMDLSGVTLEDLLAALSLIKGNVVNEPDCSGTEEPVLLYRSPKDAPPGYLSVNDAAILSGVSRNTIRNYIADGYIKAVRQSVYSFVSEEDIPRIQERIMAPATRAKAPERRKSSLEPIGMKPEDVAGVLGCHANSVIRMCRDGRMEHYKVGKRYFVTRAGLEKWLAENRRAVG